MANRLGKCALLAALAVLLAIPSLCPAKSCGPPPPAKPQRRKGGESFPPLPLPATPLRRTEKKRPPAPPALVGKIEYGKIVWETVKGRRTSYRDWTTDPNDINALVKLTNGALGIQYRPLRTSFETCSYNPAEIPILYLTGHEPFELNDEQRRKLFLFLNDGGYLIGDACCGSPEFYESFVSEMARMFPQRPLRPLSPDHPIFSCHSQIGDVEVMVEGETVGRQPSLLHGINIGCRTAVFVTPFDLSCGWDGHEHKTGKRIRIADARRLGVNMMTYCLANYQLGRFLSTQRVFHQEGEKARDEFVFVQVVHDGDWDPCPNGVMAMLRYVGANSTLPIQFSRTAVSLRDPEILRYPVLCMAGHHDFVLSEAEVAGLRNYLRNGGVLVANACCGRLAFDAAFRRELARVGPGVALKPIPLDHPLFTARTSVQSVTYTSFLRAREPDLAVPAMEGVTLSGQLAVIYSRYGLVTAWDGQERPYALAYEPEDALRLGMNIMIYAMTH